MSGKRAKNKAIEGLTIFSELIKKEGHWSGGKILDPKTGKEYKVLIELLDKGEKLKVRGYLGLRALGRTQYWQRKISQN